MKPMLLVVQFVIIHAMPVQLQPLLVHHVNHSQIEHNLDQLVPVLPIIIMYSINGIVHYVPLIVVIALVQQSHNALTVWQDRIDT